MFKHFFAIILFASIVLFSGESFSQQENNPVVHVQTWKLKSMPSGDEADAFNDMLKRQSDAVNKDSRMVRSYVLRHFWGADSRDLVIVSEFNNAQDMFSFFGELDSIMDKAISEDQRKTDGELWNKYIGQHGDEIYSVVEGTRK
jgi:hypothetical protein